MENIIITINLATQAISAKTLADLEVGLTYPRSQALALMSRYYYLPK